MRRALFSLIPLTLLSACFLVDEPANEDAGCQEVRTELSLDELSDLGISGQDLLDAVLPEGDAHQALFTYEDDEQSAMTLALDADSVAGAVFVDASPPESDGRDVLLIDWYCPDRLEVQIDMDVATEDGVFDEHLEQVTISAVEDGEGFVYSFLQELDPEAMGGSFDMDAWMLGLDSPTDYDTRSLAIDGSFSAGEVIGEISGQIGGEDDCEAGANCASWAELVPVGAFSSAEVEG